MFDVFSLPGQPHGPLPVAIKCSCQKVCHCLKGKKNVKEWAACVHSQWVVFSAMLQQMKNMDLQSCESSASGMQFVAGDGPARDGKSTCLVVFGRFSCASPLVVCHGVGMGSLFGSSSAWEGWPRVSFWLELFGPHGLAMVLGSDSTTKGRASRRPRV